MMQCSARSVRALVASLSLLAAVGCGGASGPVASQAPEASRVLPAGEGSTTAPPATTAATGGGSPAQGASTAMPMPSTGAAPSASNPSLRPLPVRRVTVSNEAELQAAVAGANAGGGGVTIVLRNGVYDLTRTLQVDAPDIAVVSESGDRTTVTIRGDVMSATATVKNLVRVAAKGFQLHGLTLERAGWHLLQIVGEADADGAIVRNCVMRDAWEQMMKVSFDAARPTVTADGGLVEHCVFEYTAGIGPQYYIGGIDAHGSKDWIVRDNVFRNIASPSRDFAEHAIHFWSDATDILVERNVIVDCDRGIGFGLGSRGARRGVIRNNVIHHTANAHPFADAAIILENSVDTAVYNNTVLQEHAYPRAIEYRFAGTTGVLIHNNLTSKAIAARDGGSASLANNVTTATRSMFRLQALGDLRLNGAHPGIVDAGRPVTGLVDDLDREPRPKGAAVDVGADEF